MSGRKGSVASATGAGLDSMSYYSTVVLSFSCCELEDPADEGEISSTCEPLSRIDAWLKRHRFEPLANLAELGGLGSNVAFFGVCCNYLNLEAFCKCVQKQKWKSPEMFGFSSGVTTTISLR
jgi:hypothetical protein